MEDYSFDTLTNNIIELFIHDFHLKLLNKEYAKTKIEEIINDFNRNCFCKMFLINYLMLFLKKIKPNFSLYEFTDNCEITKINYIEFLIVFLIILTKYIEDNRILNKTISNFYNIPLSKINKLEIFILKNLDWDLSIKIDL